MFEELAAEESDLVGQWLDTGSRIERDAVGARVEGLAAERLFRMADCPDGAVLYRDRRDGRWWKYTRA